jgi:hypothetical protein
MKDEEMREQEKAQLQANILKVKREDAEAFAAK